MTETMIYTGTLTVHTCGGCGITYAMPEDFYRRRHEDHKDFYCPAGCCRHFTGPSEAQRLRERLEREQRNVTSLRSQLDQERAEADHQAARARGYKGQLTKTRKRIAKGVCPCCNRSFTDVASHMASKHPDFGGDQ